MVTVAVGKTGQPYGIAKGITLNSRVDPEGEAENFLKIKITPTPGTIIIAGASLSYLSDKLAAMYPGSKRIVIYFDPVLSPSPFPCQEDRRGELSRSWHPGNAETLSDFLSHSLDELDMESFQLVEWLPGIKAFPDIAENFRKEMVSLVRRLNGSIITISRFGRLWIRNILKNLYYLENFRIYTPKDLPTVITAAGPSLRKIIPLLRKWRHLCNIWALPSSLTALLSENISPDIIILTDPGFWAFEHVKMLREHPEIPVLMSLSAAPGLWRTKSPVCVFSQNMFIEKHIFNALGLSPPSIPQHGTVAGTALIAAAKSVTGPVIFAGLDLGKRDGSYHIHPHSFDMMFHCAQTRLRSLHSLGYHYDNAVSVSFGKALDTYADWFSVYDSRNGPPLYRFSPSPVNLPAFIPIESEALSELLKSHVPSAGTEPYSFGFVMDSQWTSVRRRNSVSGIILSWMKICGDLISEISGTGDPSPVFRHSAIMELLFYMDFLKLKRIKGQFLHAAREAGFNDLLALLRHTLLFLSAFVGEKE